MAQQLLVPLSSFSMAPSKQQPKLVVDLVLLYLYSVCAWVLGRNKNHSLKSCCLKITQKLVMDVLRILNRRTKYNSEAECNSVYTLHGAGLTERFVHNVSIPAPLMAHTRLFHKGFQHE